MTTPAESIAVYALLALWLVFAARWGVKAVRGLARWITRRNDHA
jgi:hypothetical protein